jgi:arylsulfatase/uncharacterized sulfatase
VRPNKAGSGLAIVAILAAVPLPASAEPVRPNILLVVVDDAGFMDFGAYGSDTATPTIDALGASGAMFTRYYTLPQCGPSRASLMTGQDSHAVGIGTLPEVMTDEMQALPSYDMTWSDDQRTIASHLREAGYQTFVAGKWGIGHAGGNLPNRFGFERSWVLDATGSSNYAAEPYLPLYDHVQWYEDGKPIALPDDFYSSRNIVDRMIRYVDEADPNKPFFGYLAFQAVHLPVQVPREYVDKYNGVFDRGWDVMREERLRRAIALGLVPAGTRLAAPAYNARAWDTLTEDEQRYWARAMQVNAGMLEAADHHLGRLLQHLRERGQLDRTLILVTSDNGPEYNTIGMTSPPAERTFERLWLAYEGWDLSVENMGQPKNMVGIGHEWASVSAAPLHLFKFNASEGGLRVPLVISGPGVGDLGFLGSRSQVADIAPTVLDAAGIDLRPHSFYGRSLMPILRGATPEVYGDEDAFAFETGGSAALYRGKWKITRNPAPFGDGGWHLFDMSVDPGETVDVSAANPDLFRSMIEEYKVYTQKFGVYELPPGESARKQLTRNTGAAVLAHYGPDLLVAASVAGLVLAGLGAALRVLMRRRAP